MTPRSDQEEDMSMEEILASIRKFVTDSPSENPRQKVYKGDLADSVVIPPAGHTAGRGQEAVYSQQTHRQASSPSYEPYDEGHPQQPAVRSSQRTTPQYEADILELKSPILPSRSNVSGGQIGSEESIMTLTHAVDAKKGERAGRFSSRMSQSVGQETNLGSSHALEASANSLSRLAQVSKSTIQKKTLNLADQRDLTLDQLIQDMIRPMIKLWIDTNLPSLVEEMVAKEIKRITNHLK